MIELVEHAVVGIPTEPNIKCPAALFGSGPPDELDEAAYLMFVYSLVDVFSANILVCTVSI